MREIGLRFLTGNERSFRRVVVPSKEDRDRDRDVRIRVLQVDIAGGRESCEVFASRAAEEGGFRLDVIGSDLCLGMVHDVSDPISFFKIFHPGT